MIFLCEYVSIGLQGLNRLAFVLIEKGERKRRPYVMLVITEAINSVELSSVIPYKY